jgi:flagellar protein FliS
VVYAEINDRTELRRIQAARLEGLVIMLTGGYLQYRTVATQTGSPGELVVTLYQAAIRNIGQGRTAIEYQKPLLAHSHLMKAQEIVRTLQQTLDFQKGGEIAPLLNDIYGFVLGRLVIANINKDVAPIDEVLPLLRQLMAAWQSAVRQSAKRAS